MITCREVTEKANDYIDGKLGFWSTIQVRMHLMACRYCRAFVRQLRIVVGLVGECGNPPPPGESEQEVLDAFRRLSGRSRQ